MKAPRAEVMKILKGSGFDAKRPDRLDVAMCKDLPIKLAPWRQTWALASQPPAEVFLPAADIPSYVPRVEMAKTFHTVASDLLTARAFITFEEVFIVPRSWRVTSTSASRVATCWRKPCLKPASSPSRRLPWRPATASLRTANGRWS